MMKTLHYSIARRNLVMFRLGQQKYALPIELIVQIIPMTTITPVPQANCAIEGVINVHGAAVPAINLRRHLGLRKTTPQLHTPILLAQVNAKTIALIVDQVLDVLSLAADEVADFADFLPGGLREVPILQGLAYIENDTVLLLNLDHLLLPSQAHTLTHEAIPPFEKVTDQPGIGSPPAA